MRIALVALVCVVAGVAFAACVDVEGGETGTYGTPCGPGFGGLLLCGRENGGADPGGTGTGTGGGPGPQPATCSDACDVLVTCNGGTPTDLAECLAECDGEAIPQSLLQCIVDNGCNYYTACIDQIQGS